MNATTLKELQKRRDAAWKIVEALDLILKESEHTNGDKPKAEKKFDGLPPLSIAVAGIIESAKGAFPQQIITEIEKSHSHLHTDNLRQGVYSALSRGFKRGYLRRRKKDGVYFYTSTK